MTSEEWKRNKKSGPFQSSKRPTTIVEGKIFNSTHYFDTSTICRGLIEKRCVMMMFSGFNPPDVDVMKKVPRRRDDPLISGWVFFRYMVIGLYVGIATVGIFILWFIYGVDSTDGHSLVTYNQLSHWSHCHQW